MAPRGSLEETREHLLERIEQLEMRLEDAENILQAIRQGEVDALMISGPDGPQVYTLHSADHPYRILVQEMQEGALTLTHTGLILYANQAFARMMRTSLEHIVGTSVQRFVAPRDLHSFMALFERGARSNSRGEVTLQAADGRLIPAFLACNSFQVDDFQSECLVVTDLTEQKRQEEILVSEALARAILEQTTGALVVTDTTGRIIRASQAAHHLAGRNILLQNFDAVFALQFAVTTVAAPSVGGHDKPQVSVLHAALQREVREGLEATFVRTDGQIFQLLLSLGPLLNARGEIAGGIVTLTDITARKQAEQALQQASTELEQRVQERTTALRREMVERRRLEGEAQRAQHFALLGRLAAGVSHEIRNPLGAIFLHVDLLEEELLQPSAESSILIAQTLLEIRTQIGRLDELVQDYLSLVRVSNIQLQSHDLGASVQAWSAEIESQAVARNISLQIEGLENLGQVACHESTLRRAVLNLLQNALDAMPNGGTLSITCQSTATQVQLRVRDTGSGIPEEQLGRIFEPLYTTKPGGTGLGLYIVQEIVAAHGGQITVQSVENQGTTFIMTLPRATAQAPPQEELSQHADYGEPE
jgi:PAS domain S-box-containing protein